MLLFVFFFKQKTASEMRSSDWRSDVCSSDLPALQKQFDEAAGAASKSMRALADWLEKQRKDATQDFALGPERFARMLKTTELVHVPISELEKIGRADMKRNQEALQKACAKYAQGNTVANCLVKQIGRAAGRE